MDRVFSSRPWLEEEMPTEELSEVINLVKVCSKYHTEKFTE